MIEERTVLFVDDDEIVLRSLERGLAEELYNRLYARSGAEALEILREHEVHVMVTDMVMPAMDGLELIRIVGQKYPDIITMMLSGYAQASNVMTAVYQEGVFQFIPKPWNLEKDLKDVVRKALDHYELKTEHRAITAELDRCEAGEGGRSTPQTNIEGLN
jgi:DNA-binding NtrC family response regulator